MRVSLLPLDPPPSLRFFIRADGLHAGGITVHSVSGARFSYGIAVSGAMRRRGVASSALPMLFAAMKARGFAVCAVQIAPDNAASLALHRRLGFAETGRSAAAVTMEKCCNIIRGTLRLPSVPLALCRFFVPSALCKTV